MINNWDIIYLKYLWISKHYLKRLSEVFASTESNITIVKIFSADVYKPKVYTVIYVDFELFHDIPKLLKNLYFN